MHWCLVLLLVSVAVASPAPAEDVEGCSRNTIMFKYLFGHQSTNSALYRNFCGTHFTQTYTHRGVSEMLVFSSVLNPSVKGNETTFRSDVDQLFSSLDYVYPNTTVYRYRLVVRLARFPNSTKTLNVHLNYVNYPIRLLPNKFEYMLQPSKPSFNYSVSDLSVPVVQFETAVEELLNESYIALCVQPKKMSALCDLYIEGYGIECYCKSGKLGFMVLAIELCFIAFGIWIVMLKWGFLRTDTEPELQSHHILCMPGRSNHEYLAIFRVGPATNGFDFDNNWVDILLFTGKQEPVGVPTRYTTVCLPQRATGEMHMVICRISPQVPITGIMINHGDQKNLLYFLDFTLVNLRDDCAVMQEEIIDQFITDEPTLFPVLPSQAPDPIIKQPSKGTSKASRQQEQSKMKLPNSKMDHMLNSQNKPLSDRRERLLRTLTERLTICEKMSFCMLATGLVALVVTIFKTDLEYYRFWKDMAMCMGQFAICVLTAAAVAWLVVGLLEWFYLWLIKHRNMVERFSVEEEVCTTPCCLTKYAFLGSLQVLGLILMAHSVYLSVGLDDVGGLLWSGMFFTALVLALGGWYCADDLLTTYQRLTNAQKDFTELLPGAEIRQTSVASRGSRVVRTNRSMPRKVSSLGLNALNQSSVPESSYGPKLQNPLIAHDRASTTKAAPVESIPRAASKLDSKSQPRVDSYQQFMRRASSSMLGRGKSRL